MKARYLLIALAAISALAAPAARSAPQGFQEATVTEAVNQVEVLAGPTARAARVQDRVRGNDVVRTGRASRAELKFPDATIARVGANAAFSFRPETRGFDLKQGSILFHSPKGMGGGQIRTASATASVLGTTIVVVATPNGGFKFLVLEGKGKLTLPNGRSLVLQAGQMTFILANTNKLPPILTFRLSQQVGDSLLVNGFGNMLASLGKIQDVIERQEHLIQTGRLNATKFLIGHLRDNDKLELIDDPNSLPQKTDLLQLLQLTGGQQYFLDLLDRYHYMMRHPGIVGPGELDPRHVIAPHELDNPIHLEAFLMALLAVSAGPDGPAEDPLPDPSGQANFIAFQPFCAGFVGNGIAFAAPLVRLGAFRACDVFTFFSLADIFMRDTLEFAGYRGTVELIASGSIHIPDNARIGSLTPGMSLDLLSSGSLELNDVTFCLPGGSLGIASAGAINISCGSWLAPEGLTIAGAESVSILNFTFGSCGYGNSLDESVLEGPSLFNSINYESPYMPPPAPVHVFSGGPVLMDNVDWGNANLHVFTPDTFTIEGFFYANALAATAGTFDVDWNDITYYNSFDFLRLLQFDPWSLCNFYCSVPEDIAIGSLGDLGLSEVGLSAGKGILLLGDNVTIDGGEEGSSDFTAYDTYGGEGITVDAKGDLAVCDSSFLSANHIDLIGRDIMLDGVDIEVDSPDIRHTLRVDARRDLNIANSSLRSTSLIDLRAANDLTVNNTFFQAQRIRMQATTLSLTDIDFPDGSLVTLESLYGVLAPSPNTGAAKQYGKVNYINGVKYSGVLLDANNHANITIKPR